MKSAALFAIFILLASLGADLEMGWGPYTGRPWLAILAILVIAGLAIYLSPAPPETNIVATCAQCGGVRAYMTNPIDNEDLITILNVAHRKLPPNTAGIIFTVRSRDWTFPSCKCDDTYAAWQGEDTTES